MGWMLGGGFWLATDEKSEATILVAALGFDLVSGLRYKFKNNVSANKDFFII